MSGLEPPMLYLVVAGVAYLLGSIPFGLILTRLSGAGDLRTIGSGNIGATNVLRTGRKGLALATLVLDAAKGALPVLIARLWLADPVAEAVAGGAAFLGHLFPVWLAFRGGKGVATFYGVLLAVHWPSGLLAALIWIAVAALFRISSLAALLASAAAPFSVAVFAGFGPPFGLSVLMAGLIWVRHYANIERLIQGREPRLGQTVAPPSDSDA